MDKSSKMLSELIVYMKYSRYAKEKNRRESWDELCDRNSQMHIRKYPNLKTEIEELYSNYVKTRRVLPSMRSMQFAGPAIETNNARMYNCAYMLMNDYHAFSETMFLLLGGSGVGYSVQKQHVAKLPALVGPSSRKRKHVVDDSIMGWADTIKALVKAHFFGKPEPVFDYSCVRDKGAELVTAGGKAPGPEPLRMCVAEVTSILFQAKGRKLTPLEVHDIQCHIADAVLAGGIRRSACISFFSPDDTEMLECKAGDWWETHPQRGRANNSMALLRHSIDKEAFLKLWSRVEASGSGEPGIYWTNDLDHGSNPCCEIALKPQSFCNLTEINGGMITCQEEYNDAAKAAAFLGTLQAGYTDFYYLRDEWRDNVEEEALLGVSPTGISNEKFLELNHKEAVDEVIKTNRIISNRLGISSADRTTTVKPSGTASIVLGTSSGIHAWHDTYYIRNIRVGKDEAVYRYFRDNYPLLVADEQFRPDTQAVIGLPIKAPEGAITRESENAESFLERVKKMSTEWVKYGHVKGVNTHNVSATCTIKPDEWESVGEWMWNNRDVYNGLSVLPEDLGTYVQAPFESCTKEKYEELMQYVGDFDVQQIIETEDNTNLQGEIACGGSGGSCEIT